MAQINCENCTGGSGLRKNDAPDGISQELLMGEDSGEKVLFVERNCELDFLFVKLDKKMMDDE